MILLLVSYIPYFYLEFFIHHREKDNFFPSVSPGVSNKLCFYLSYTLSQGQELIAVALFTFELCIGINLSSLLWFMSYALDTANVDTANAICALFLLLMEASFHKP